MKKILLLSIFFAAIGAQGTKSLAQEANYDESKVPAYTLPEVLVTQDGRRVNSVTDWETKRRPEILALFSEQVYGKTPTQKIPVRFEVTDLDRNALGGKATRKQVRGYFSVDKAKYMDILIYLPNRVGEPISRKPVPVFLGLNFAGNQTVHADPDIAITQNWVPAWKDPGIIKNHSTKESRGTRARRWPVEQILARGYGLATVYYGDLQPDRADSFNAGIHPLFFQKRPGPACR